LALLLPCASIDADAGLNDSPVQLPPLLVEQTYHGGTWRYAQVPGFEILSRCNDQTTTQLVAAFQHARDTLAVLLPERFQLRLDAPQALIIYDDERWTAATKEATELLLKKGFAVSPPPREDDDSSGSLLSALADPERKRTPAKTVDRYFANLRLADADTTTTFAVVSHSSPDPKEMFLTARYVAQLIGSRQPALPSWFTAGFLAFYQNITFGDASLRLARPSNDDPQKPLIPLADFLSAAPENPVTSNAVWLTESELFVRWCLDPRMNAGDALWRFLDELPRTSNRTELFSRCFGLTSTEAIEQLEIYRRSTSTTTTKWKLGPSPAAPPVEIREATPNQVARIKGEWERLVVRYVRKELPAFESVYLTQARHTLRRAYDRGDRDGQLLASLGLLELDDSRTELAREFLEAAAEKSVVRPRVYFECAKFRYDEELGRVRRNDGKLTREQAARVLQSLLVAEKQAPSLAPVYELIADVWANCAESPAATDLEIIDRGVGLFPESSELVYRAALLHHARGDRQALHGLVELGKRTLTTETARSRLEQLERN
jgi:hypothetical protein